MPQDGSVAPKERINIKYVSSAQGQQSEMELPFKLLVLGDFKGHPEDVRLEDRATVQVNKSNFESVMKESNLSVTTSVANKLSGKESDDLRVELQFDSLQDFSPDSIAAQVPELKKLIELREALVALKGPLGNIPAFRMALQDLIETQESREALLQELQQLEQ